jgi:quercetin dioxygenase-like cupin family protein
LDTEIWPLLAEARANPSHRAAKTLSKDAALTVVLMAVAGRTEVLDHNLHGSALLHVLHGHLRVQLGDEDITLRSGEVISLADRVPHRLAALEDSVMLLAIPAPAVEAAQGLPAIEPAPGRVAQGSPQAH